MTVNIVQKVDRFVYGLHLSLVLCCREDDVANEIAALSLEASKGEKDAAEEDVIAPVKKKEKVKFSEELTGSADSPKMTTVVAAVKLETV